MLNSDLIPLTRGLKISVEKSRAFASRRLSGNIRKDISDITQIGFTNNLGKCLGFKMFQGRPRRDDYLEIIDKVDSPLQTQFSPCPWNAHCWNSIKKNSSLTLTKDSVSKSNPKRGMLPNQRNMAALVFV